ncbi:MAG: cytochrome c oxidase subunit II [Candidatus Zixiibacteriota bacterium]
MDSTGTLWLPPANSTIAGEVDPLFHFILYGSIAMFAIVAAGILYFSWRYRRRGADRLNAAATHNTPLEIIWTVIPTILVMIVFVWGFKTFIKMHVAPKDALEIKVTAQKWFWTFDYPTGANSVNDLVVPLGKPVKLLMSSRDVIHSCFVPNFRIKQDVLPNRYTITWFEATKAGTYDMFCTEFCGKGHSEMLGKVRVVSDREYLAWQDANAQLGTGLTPEEYGAQLYKSKACFTCHSVDGTRLVGPSFKGRFGQREQMTDGAQLLVDENYIRESILQPKAKVVTGYDPVMPTYQGVLKDQQIDALIAYIKSLK